MVTALVLAFPDFNATFVVESNTFNGGLRVVSSRNGRPIAFFSKVLSSKHQTLSVYEREMQAILTVVKKCNAYLLGRHFQIKTNHQNLKFILYQKANILAQQV